MLYVAKHISPEQGDYVAVAGGESYGKVQKYNQVHTRKVTSYLTKLSRGAPVQSTRNPSKKHTVSFIFVGIV